PDARLRPNVGKMVSDRLHQMGLAQAHAAVYEQRVVRNARVFRDLDRGSARELVRLAGDEALEAEALVETAALGCRRRLGGARLGLGGPCKRFRAAREHQT